MESQLLQSLITDILWVVVAIGWATLIVTGLEADKPLSGGIPGHVDPTHDQLVAPEGVAGRLGTLGGWVLFITVSLALPFVLWWIFNTHT